MKTAPQPLVAAPQPIVARAPRVAAVDLGDRTEKDVEIERLTRDTKAWKDQAWIADVTRDDLKKTHEELKTTQAGRDKLHTDFKAAGDTYQAGERKSKGQIAERNTENGKLRDEINSLKQRILHESNDSQAK